jgi:uncharacterized protein Smg (DUF494 family)
MTKWWEVVNAFSEFVAAGIEAENLGDHSVYDALRSMGFQSDDIETAYEWIERASLHGSIDEVFSMFQPVLLNRVSSPVEQLFMSETSWTKIESLRVKGIVSLPTIERILISLRNIDSRDWDEDDMDAYLKEVVTDALPCVSTQTISDVVDTTTLHHEFYS